MRKILFALVVLGLASSYAFADGKDVTIKGTVIDNDCAGMHKADLASFAKTHDKACALKCGVKAGYAIYSNGKLTKIADKSNAKVTEFLTKAGSKTDVTIMGDQMGNAVTVESIKNQ